MQTLELRPLSLGEILDRVFTIYRKYFLLFFGIAAIPRLLVLALNEAQLFLGARPGVRESTGAAISSGAIGFLTLIVTLLAYLLIQGATVTAVSELYLGHTISIGQAFRRVRGQLGLIFGILFLTGLASAALFAPLLFFIGSPIFVIGVLLWVVLAVYLGCRLLVSVPAGLLEDQGAIDSLKRSWALSQGFAGRAFLILVLYLVLTFSAAFLFAWPFGIAVVFSRNNPNMMYFWMAMMQVGAFLAEVLVQPFITIASAVFYYDLRVRKEALDIELLMDPDALRAPAPSIVPSMFS